MTAIVLVAEPFTPKLVLLQYRGTLFIKPKLQLGSLVSRIVGKRGQYGMPEIIASYSSHQGTFSNSRAASSSSRFGSVAESACVAIIVSSKIEVMSALV